MEMQGRTTRDKRKRLLQRNVPFDKWKKKITEGVQTSALTVPTRCRCSRAARQELQQCHLPSELALPVPEHLQGPLPLSPLHALLSWHLHRVRTAFTTTQVPAGLLWHPAFVGSAVMVVENGRRGGRIINHLFKKHT